MAADRAMIWTVMGWLGFGVSPAKAQRRQGKRDSWLPPEAKLFFYVLYPIRMTGSGP